MTTATPSSPAPPVARLTAIGVLTQTGAMFVDAYRELNSKKLFWITMVLSAVVVGAFGSVGFDATGFSIFTKHFSSPLINTAVLPLAQLYKNLFVALGVQWWLGFLAILLALVSTAPLFPDFLSNGAVDLYLARPLGRARLLLTKYVVGLLFVAVQVAVFCLASFVVIGIRGGAWVPGLFLAVPVVVLMFSYLWSICTLVGVVTRSTIASLLLTVLAWALIFGVHATESTLLRFSIGTRIEATELDGDIARCEADLAALKDKPAATQPKSFESARIFTLTSTLESLRAERAKVDDPFDTWHALAYAVKWPLPKTTETTNLLERWLDRQFRAAPARSDADNPDDTSSRNFFRNSHVRRLTAIETDRVLRARSPAWVIGTSLLFEAAMLGLATWTFARRDY